MPPLALANDLMIFYAPRELYTKKVTILEMICASPCLTSMICFSLEKKYRGERAVDEQVHMNRHRMGARGNATSFPLPWQDLLQQLQGTGADLPHTGEALSTFVSVLLKTSDEGDTKESLAKFIHQALVRRDVVISLIENAWERGHRAYRHLDMDRVRQKAQDLPANGVPEHILKLMPFDDLLDKIQVQKAATPVPARSVLKDVATQMSQIRSIGVVLEQSSYDEADINAQRVSAIRQFASRLNMSEPDAIEANDANRTELADISTADVRSKVAQGKRVKLSAANAETIADEYKQHKK